MKAGWPLIKIVLQPLVKSVSILLGLMAAASAADVKMHKKFKVLGLLVPSTTTLIISNGKMDDVMNIVKSLEDSGLLLKDITKTIENETKEQKCRIFSIVLGALRDSIPGSLLSSK